MSLAALAPGLSEAELRVCLYLASIQDPEQHSARASSRQIAEATRLARPNVQRALDRLTRRCLIATRQGAGQKASAYRLNFTQTTALTSGIATMPLAQTTLELQAPEWHRSNATSPATSPPSISIPTDTILDRVLTARPAHFETSQLAQVRGWAYKWLTLQRGQANAQAPDAQVCARIATAAGSPGAACDWIHDHMTDHQAETCEYIVRWMLQALHHCPPETVRRRHAQLRAVAGRKHKPEPADAIGEQPTPDAGDGAAFADDAIDQLRKVKGF